MNIKEALYKEHSKANTAAIAKYIGDSPDRFAVLMQLFLCDEVVLCQRAAWVFTRVTTFYPELMLPYLDDMVLALENAAHPALQRNALRAIAITRPSLSEDIEGQLVNLSFDLLANPQMPVAVRVHAMQCIANLLDRYPDLAIELKPLIEDGMENGSAGFRSRGRKVLRIINRLERQQNP